MATITIRQAQYYSNERGHTMPLRGGPELPNIKETAGQTYGAGDPVYYDSNGTIALVVASGNQIANIAGFAFGAATGVTGTSVVYRPITNDDIYIINVKGHVPTNNTIALTQIGVHYNLNLSGNNLVVDLDNSFDATKLYIKVLSMFDTGSGYKDGDTVGDTNGRLVCLFPTQVALQG